jgi:hypothetical protein
LTDPNQNLSAFDLKPQQIKDQKTTRIQNNTIKTTSTDTPSKLICHSRKEVFSFHHSLGAIYTPEEHLYSNTYHDGSDLIVENDLQVEGDTDLQIADEKNIYSAWQN